MLRIVPFGIAEVIIVKEILRFPYAELLREGGRDWLPEQERQETAEAVGRYLASCGFSAEFTGCRPGPVYSCYDFRLKPGEKLERRESAAVGLGEAMGIRGVFIRPIPGEQSALGIEIPNRHAGTVTLRDVIESQRLRRSSSPLTCGLGWGTDGDAVTIDLLKLPHLLVSGAHGSGKSACLHAMILTLLSRAEPDEMKLLLIDPKAQEFTKYDGLPQLSMPVVTEPGRAVDALQWAVDEIRRRYRLMEAYGEKDIESYNNWQADHQEMALPRIVIFIDELEALMRENPRRTEENLCLLTQIGRASGIHVIAATQNLTSSVITDRIKSEMPDRIVFRTASTQESRSLLGDTGAEELENSGDMLITVTGMPIRRAHEADVRPDEIEAVAKYLRRGEK